MRILYCHNYYQQRGGEDISFESDVAMLREKGHDVETLVRSNDDLQSEPITRTVLNTIWNHRIRSEVDELITKFQPDVLHCNNLFPQISPSIYRTARRRGVAVVQALRNYRAFCANSFFYRDDNVCTKCHNSRMRLSAVRHRCYRDSYAASAVVTTMQFVHHTMGTYRNAVDMYFTPSAFARNVYIEGGFASDSIGIKPNFVDPDPGVGNGDGQYFVFAGRLSTEKGIGTLLKAWNSQQIALPLKIIGDGPLMSLARNSKSNVECLGRCSHDEVLQTIGRATALIMPSQWYETFGRTIAESFSRGTPVVVSDLGSMAELVQHGVNGFQFQAGNVSDLIQKVNLLTDYNREQLRLAARESFLKHYTRDASYQALMAIYRRAKERRDFGLSRKS